MSETVKIELMVLVGSNGKSSAAIRGHLGWGDLADNLMDYVDGTYEDPEFSDRYVVEIEVAIPTSRELIMPSVVTRVEA